MTDPFTQPVEPGKQTNAPRFIQISKELIDYVRSLKLTGTQYDLWLFLYSLDPYGDRFIEVPSPKDIGILLNVDYRTIERAAQRLADCNLFEFQIERWKARNRKTSITFPQNSLGKEIQNIPNGSNVPHLDLFDETGISLPRVNQTSPPKPLQHKGLAKGTVPNKEQTLLETTEQHPTSHPVFQPYEQEKSLVLAQLLLQVESAGIRLNKTIRATIEQLAQQLGEPAAVVRVRNALSAVQERQEQGTVRNPGGLFNKALRDGYTANQAKAQVRERRADLLSTPEPPLLNQVSVQIDSYLISDRRDWALNKLQQLWSAGWHDQLEELLQLRCDWGFSLTEKGVQDASS